MWTFAAASVLSCEQRQFNFDSDNPVATSYKPPRLKPRKTVTQDSVVTRVIGFVAHSITRLRGKADAAGPSQPQGEREHIILRSPWRAVEIISDPNACAAAKNMTHLRFLCDEAPKLPLAGCTRVHCTCKYKHYSDRRVGPRRASESGIPQHVLAKSPDNNRRERRGRRSTDIW